MPVARLPSAIRSVSLVNSNYRKPLAVAHFSTAHRLISEPAESFLVELVETRGSLLDLSLKKVNYYLKKLYHLLITKTSHFLLTLTELMLQRLKLGQRFSSLIVGLNECSL